MSVACLKNATTQAVAPSGAFGDSLSLHAVGDSILSPQICVVKLSSSKSASSQAILALFTGMTEFSCDLFSAELVHSAEASQD